jgi:hypothetical protein
MLMISHCLYIPQCTVCLLCPRQIGISTGHPTDGFNTLASTSSLIVQGKTTNLQYDSLTKLPLWFTAPGHQV